MEVKGKDPLSLSHVLSESNRLGFIIKKAKSLLALQNVINDIVPPLLKKRCTVMNIQGSRLILCVDSGALATRLNYHIPEILESVRFHNRFSYIQSIQIKVLTTL